VARSSDVILSQSNNLVSKLNLSASPPCRCNKCYEISLLLQFFPYFLFGEAAAKK